MAHPLPSGQGRRRAVLAPGEEGLSLREALRLKHNYIGTEHILLGLIREGNGLAALVLTRAGLSLDELRSRVLDALKTAA